MIDFTKYCHWEPVRALIFSGNVPEALVYYAHFTPFIAGIVFAVWFYIKNRGSTPAKILSVAIGAFCLWTFSDMVLFATDRPELVMFFWSLLSLFEPLIYAGLFFFFYTYTVGRPVSPRVLTGGLIASFVAFAPILILLGTSYNLHAFDLSDCGRDAIEGGLVTYVYAVDIIYAVLIIATLIYGCVKLDKALRPKIVSVGLAITSFMAIFGLGNLIGSYTTLQWRFAQYGLLGLPFFILIILFVSTRVKLFAGQTIRPILLVAIMWFTVFSLLFADLSMVMHILIGALLILISFSSRIFVKVVREDNEKTKKIKKLDTQLRNLNAHLEDRVKEQTKELLGAYEIEKKARIELQRISDEKDRFIMITQHELRTPLTALKWGAQSMLSGVYGKINKDQKEYCQSAVKSSERLIGVVNRMVDSNEENLYGSTGSEERSVFMPVVDRVLAALEMFCEEKKITIVKDIKADPATPLRISTEKLYQIVSNLIDNALKYTPIGGTITVGLYSDDGATVMMKIKDTGIGIPLDAQKMLFSKFYRATNAITMHPDGSGLGLSIVKSLAEQTGGSISIESEGEGKGTTVTVMFQKVV